MYATACLRFHKPVVSVDAMTLRKKSVRNAAEQSAFIRQILNHAALDMPDEWA